MPFITPRRDRGGLSRHRRLLADLRTTINDVVQFQANPDLRPPFAALIAEAQRDPALAHLLLERFIRPRRRSTVPGVTSRCGRRLGDRTRISAARTARSAPSRWGRGWARRSTATS